MKVEVTNSKVELTAKGSVAGAHWGGGYGGYASRMLDGTSKKDILEKAKEGLKTGSLDSGMGFESLKFARLGITTHTVLTIDGKDYAHEDIEHVTVWNPNITLKEKRKLQRLLAKNEQD